MIRTVRPEAEAGSGSITNRLVIVEGLVSGVWRQSVLGAVAAVVAPVDVLTHTASGLHAQYAESRLRCLASNSTLPSSGGQFDRSAFT